MNNLLQLWGRVRLAASSYWLARSAQEQRFLGVGGAVVLLALFYSVLVEPALDGRDALQKSLPLLRQDAADMQALAREAGALAGTTRVAPPPMTRDSLSAALAGAGLTPQSLSVTGEYAKLQFKGVGFTNLLDWLAGQRRDGRIAVQEATITSPAGAAPPTGLVDATLTLHQAAGNN
jgi:general secretion pathway protein M